MTTIHSSPALSLSLSLLLLSVSSCLSRRRTELTPPDDPRRIGPNLFLPFSLSLSLSTARDESRGLRALGNRRPTENPVPTFSLEWKRRNKRSKRNKVTSWTLRWGRKLMVRPRTIHICRTVRYQCSLPSVECDWAANEYIYATTTLRRCRYGRRDGGALSRSRYCNVSYLILLSSSRARALSLFCFFLIYESCNLKTREAPVPEGGLRARSPW